LPFHSHRLFSTPTFFQALKRIFLSKSPIEIEISIPPTMYQEKMEASPGIKQLIVKTARLECEKRRQKEQSSRRIELGVCKC